MSLDQLPFNLFDLLVVVVLVAGLTRGRKHGMSEELIGLIEWLVILFGCAALYQAGGQMIGGFTTMFGELSRYLLAYMGAALVILLLFVGIKRVLGGKLVGSDIFGQSEYYLGMVSGVARCTCMLLVGLALLNARYFSPKEVRAMQAYQDDVYGSDFFPTLQSIQTSVFDKSLTGPWIKDNLGFLLIKPTEPETKQFHQQTYKLP